MYKRQLLSLIVWLPVLGAIPILALGSERAQLARGLSLLVAVLTFLLSLVLWQNFDNATSGFQLVEKTSWIAAWNIDYWLGVDGISLPFVVLTTFTTVLVVLAGWKVITKQVQQYYAAFIAMEGLMLGMFSALDSMLFYIFFEAMLIPMFLIIGMWGGPRRVYATIKFFLYTFFGSVFMLVALIYLHQQSNSFSIEAFQQLPLSMEQQKWIFLAFLAAFAVKIPMWPVHTWLPDAHVEAPTGGSVILAAIMLKIGGYGFLRFSLPIAPDASLEFSGWMIALSLIAVVYIGFVALVQEDMKKLIAYSSISHMGFVTLGTFVVIAMMGNADSADAVRLGLEGAMVQMVSHGFVAGAMFLGVGVLYDRMHTRMIRDYGGVANKMPWFTFFAVLFAMANAGLPGTSGFVGEFMVILSTFQANPWFAFAAASTLIIGAAYTLWMVKRVMFGAEANPEVENLTDLDAREALILGILAVVVVAIGVWPEPLLNIMHVSIDQLVQHVAAGKLG
ncbi:MAG: NADH-quinone oxidoreductase subunit M [bacterium]